MRNFHRLITGVNVEALLFQLASHEPLWGTNTKRKDFPGSPHAAADDIWLRWRGDQELDQGNDPFHSTWLPAEQRLPAIRPIVMGLMATVGATELGGVFVTRLPPQRQILPHSDKGGWHAEFMNVKLYLPLLTNERCVNLCDGEEVVMGAGEVWLFNNLKMHCVRNDGDTDRMTLIACMRMD
jgi:Aspartyl/Asparaginyl beta-hydroxylase